MRFANWKTASIFFAGILTIGCLALWVAPVLGGGQQPQREKPPVGLEQAQELAQFASQAMREGNYKEAIFALHSASFILEEGLGWHMPNFQPPMHMGPMPQPGPGMAPGSMPPAGPGMGPKGEDFNTALERSKARAEELKKAGGELGDIPERLTQAEEAFKAGNKDEAWEILKLVKEELNKVKCELSQNQNSR